MSGYRIPARIETERLVLRRYAPDDAEQLAAVVTANIAHLERYMEWIAFEPQTVEQRRAWISENRRAFDAGTEFTLGMFAVDGRLIGGTGFHVRGTPGNLGIGYWIDREHEGRGLVTEAAAALTVVGIGFAGADVIDIDHAPSNVRSGAIPARLGFARQPDSVRECQDSGVKVHSVTWWATPATLTKEPLASVPRPRIYDDAGVNLEWPA